MACDESRERFPFDVQHRSIVRYKTESARDFETVGQQITSRLEAAMETQLRIGKVEDLSPAAPAAGLTPHELVALVTIAATTGIDGDPLTSYALRQAMGQAGYNDVASSLAVRGLIKKEYVDRSSGYDGGNEYWGLIATDSGLDWLDSNQHLLRLKRASAEEEAHDDDLPF
jgi:hypothetical protein